MILPCKLLGVEIHPATINDWHRLIQKKLALKQQCIIVSQNLHSVYTFHRDDAMQQLHKMAYKRIDGMSLIILGRLLGYSMRREYRVTWVDWMQPLMRESARRGWRVYYLGSKPDVVEHGMAMLRKEFPQLNIRASHGYFDLTVDSPENQERLSDIKAFQPAILIVGMGMPRQEHWILRNLDHLPASIILTSGAAMEYVTGQVSTPPRWMGRWGLEWLFRLAENPQRFWRRYLIEPWFILKLVVYDLARLVRCRRGTYQ